LACTSVTIIVVGVVGHEAFDGCIFWSANTESVAMGGADLPTSKMSVAQLKVRATSTELAEIQVALREWAITRHHARWRSSAP